MGEATKSPGARVEEGVFIPPLSTSLAYRSGDDVRYWPIHRDDPSELVEGDSSDEACGDPSARSHEGGALGKAADDLLE